MRLGFGLASCSSRGRRQNMMGKIFTKTHEPQEELQDDLYVSDSEVIKSSKTREATKAWLQDIFGPNYESCEEVHDVLSTKLHLQP